MTGTVLTFNTMAFIALKVMGKRACMRACVRKGVGATCDHIWASVYHAGMRLWRRVCVTPMQNTHAGHPNTDYVIV